MGEDTKIRRLLRASAKLKRLRWRTFLWGAIAGLTATAFIIGIRAVAGRERATSVKSAIEVQAEYTLEDVEESVILTGDGGDADAPALELLRLESMKLPKQTTVLFLGDNVYPRGIPPEGARDRADAIKKLQKQLHAVTRSGARGIFIPGNHDWNMSSDGGWQSVKRQAELVTLALGPKSYFPSNGCPGPEQAYLSPRFRILALDSEWWGHPGGKPSDPSSGCPTFTREMVAAETDRLLAAKPAGVLDLVITHHPFESDGRHSRSVRCPNGRGCPDNIAMREMLGAVFSKYRPFMCAAGHDHSLQLLNTEKGCRYYAVSGALSNSTGVTPRRGAVMSFNDLGFIRLDALKDGRVAFTFVHFTPGGSTAKETVWLEQIPLQ